MITRGTVRSGATGRIIPCCWAECSKPGLAQHQIVIRQGGRNLIYLFCSPRHALLYANGHREYGHLPAGMSTSGGGIVVPAPRPPGPILPSGGGAA